MILGKVTGTIVASQQHAFYRGKTQLLVRYTLPDGSFDGDKYVIALDMVGAGIGETVLVKDEGTSARQIMNTDQDGPVRSLVVGIVDSVTVGNG